MFWKHIALYILLCIAGIGFDFIGVYFIFILYALHGL
jgi:hypothetical protein